MAASIRVLLSFIPGRLKKLLDFGREHGIKTAAGTLKNATISMHIIDFILDLRHDPFYIQILNRERITLLALIPKALDHYAASKGCRREPR